MTGGRDTDPLRACGRGRKRPFLDERPAVQDAMAEIDFQHDYCCPADGRESLKDRALPAKVVGPDILSRMEQSRHLPRVRIDPRDIRTLMIVTWETGQREVLKRGRTAVLFGDDVIDFVDGVRQRLRHLAILAARRRSMPHPFSQESVHPLLARTDLQGPPRLRFDQPEETADSFVLFRLGTLVVRE